MTTETAADPGRLYYVLRRGDKAGIAAVRHLLRIKEDSAEIDGVPLSGARPGSGAFSWDQDSGGIETAGRFEVVPPGIFLLGTMSWNVRGTASQPCSHESAGSDPVVATAVPPTVYKTLITAARQPKGTNPAGLPPHAWRQGIEMEVGFEYEHGNPIPITTLTLHGQQYLYFSLDLAPGGAVRLTLTGWTGQDVLCSFDEELYLRGFVVFSGMGDRISGEIHSTCRDREAGLPYFWKGAAAGAAWFEALRSRFSSLGSEVSQ